MKKILSIILCLALVLSLAAVVSADETLSVVAPGSNTADFSALVDTTGTVKDQTYGERTSADGWHAVNTALNVSDFIGSTAVVLNGKVTAPGVLTSGTLTGPLSSVSFSYGFPFSDKQFSLTINVKQGETVVATTTVEKTDLAKTTAYNHVWNLETAVEGEFTLELVNNCLSAATGNKDRLAIWNLTWSSEAGEAPSTPVEPSEPSEPSEPVVAPSDPKEIVDAAFKLASGESLPYEATLTGPIVSIDTPYSSQYGNITVTIEVEGTDGKHNLQCYRMKGDGAEGLSVGDTITVTGTIKNYNGTVEFDAGCQVSNIVKGETPVVVPTDPKEIVDAAFALEPGASLPYEATLTGPIVRIESEYSEQYGNISVVIEVEGTTGVKELLCYRLKGDGAATLAVGDNITVTGQIKNYNGTIEFTNCTFVLNGEPPIASAPVTETGDPIAVVMALLAAASLGIVVIGKKKF